MFTSHTDFFAATATMASKRVLADMDPDYEDITKDQVKRQRIIEEDGTAYEILTPGDIEMSLFFLRVFFWFNCDIVCCKFNGFIIHIVWSLEAY